MAVALRCTQTGSGPADRMRGLLDALKSSNGSNETCKSSLQQIYDLTRLGHAQQMGSSLERSDINLLGKYAFEDGSLEIRQLALRCLHNLLHQAPSATQMFVDEGFLQKCISLLKSTDSNDEFIGARLLIVSANHAGADLLRLLENSDLADAINANIARHTSTESASLACDANLNLLSLLAAKHEAQTYRFLDSLDPILTMLDKAPVQPRPLESPVSQLISCLVMLVYYGTAVKKSWSLSTAEKLVKILRVAVTAYKDEDLDTRIQPLVSLLLCVASSASDGVKESLKAQLLPSEEDRKQVLGKGVSLPHRVVKISTDTPSLELKVSLASLLFELSDRDQHKLTGNVGFGCAVGLLHVLGVPVEPSDSNATGDQPLSNPVTGQLLENESQPNEPPMTDEEKEREAERLFVLFERLNRTGVISVQNPFAAAMESGRVEEIP